MSDGDEGTRRTRGSRKAGLHLMRGLFGRCPACGHGNLFRSFVKVVHECSACSEAFHHHRADDFPAYLTMVLIGLGQGYIVQRALLPDTTLERYATAARTSRA